MPASPIRFARFEIQPHERRLLVDGVPVTLGARAFDLLLAMVRRPGQLLDKSQLLEEVWPGRVVEEGNLTVQVSGLRKVLGGELIATIPGRGYRFTGRPEQIGAPASAVVPTGDAAAATQAPVLIGRDADLARVDATLQAPGIVTLTGPAGVGKTTLARALAARCEGGAVWVDLAPLTEGAQAPSALARALGVALPAGVPWPALLQALEGRVLVLDNAEHLVDAIAHMAAALVQAGPRQRVLVTSQRLLRVDGERVERLGPLELPLEGDAPDLERGAVALFVDRVKAADRRFRAGPEQLPLLPQICRALDGIPLALEMAAARVPVLGLAGLRDALEQRFALLRAGRRHAAARHRTLEAALDWSHDLLAPDEQRLFRACSVFSGGFTLDLLLQVTTPSGATTEETQRWAVIDTLTQLVESSLVTSDHGDPPRFMLLETMRDYAGKRLLASGEEASMRQSHAHVMADLARQAAARTIDPRAQRLMLAEHDNLREAIAWLLAHEPSAGVAMAIDVASVASYSAWGLEALRWLESCEPFVEGGGASPHLRADWWRECARQRIVSRDPRARATSERALELYQSLGDDLGEFLALGNVVRAAHEGANSASHCAAMRAVLERHPEWPLSLSVALAGAEALACEYRGDYEGRLQHRLLEYDLAMRCGWQAAADAADTNVVAGLVRLGRSEEALARILTILERLADKSSRNAAYGWNALLGILLNLGRYDEFRAAVPRAAPVMRRNNVSTLPENYARLLAQEGRARDAARMIGHVHSTYRVSGRMIEPITQRSLQFAEDKARETLDEVTFAACVAEGREFDDAAADRLALAAAAP